MITHFKSSNEMYDMWAENLNWEQSYADASTEARLNYFFFTSLWFTIGSVYFTDTALAIFSELSEKKRICFDICITSIMIFIKLYVNLILKVYVYAN